MAVNSNYSKDEISFFKNLLLNDIRPDGRQRHESKIFKLKENILPSTFSSLELKNSETNIFFSLKADVSKSYQGISVTCDSLSYKSIFSNTKNSSQQTNKDLSLPSLNEIQEILFIIDKLVLSKISREELRVTNRSPLLELSSEKEVERILSQDVVYYWQLSINIFSLEKIYLHNLQTIAFGINHLLLNAELPSIGLYKNVLTEEIDYEVVESKTERLNLSLPEILVVGSFNGNLFLDPSMEELSVVEALVLLTIKDRKTTHFETYGMLVDLGNLSNLDKFISLALVQRIEKTRVNVIGSSDECKEITGNMEVDIEVK